MSETLVTRSLRPGLDSLEDAVVAALLADATISSYAQEVSPFQGALEDAISEQSWRDPSILVLFAGGPIEAAGSEDVRITCEWQVIVRARNLRGNAARQAPTATGEVGTYQMVADVLRVLTHRTLDLEGAGALEPQGVELLAAAANPDRALSAYLLVFTQTVELQAIAPDVELAEVGATLDGPVPDSGAEPPVTIELTLETS